MTYPEPKITTTHVHTRQEGDPYPWTANVEIDDCGASASGSTEIEALTSLVSVVTAAWHQEAERL